MNARLITETRPLPRDTVAAKGCSCGWCRPPSRSGTCCLCRSERDRPPGWGREQRAGSSWPGQWSPVTGEGRFLPPRAAFVPAPGLITRVPAEAGRVAAAGEDGGPTPGPQAPSPTPWNWPSALRGAGGAHPHGRLGGWDSGGGCWSTKRGSGRGWSLVVVGGGQLLWESGQWQPPKA